MRFTWRSGYSMRDIEDAQERYGLRFPPDLIELFLERRPVQAYDWRGENSAIRQMLAWPFELLQFDIEAGSFWMPQWGNRPSTKEERTEVLRKALDQAPRLIPIYGHRFLPETPSEAGNPVFSMHGADTIYYGANLAEYFHNETTGEYILGPIRQIPFWSDLVDLNY